MTPGKGGPVLEVRDLARCFGGRDGRDDALAVIEGLSLAVAEGEFVTVAGPSGSGKSTLLNMIAQIDRPSEGTIHLRGETILAPGKADLNPGWNCQIGYVTQEDNLLPWRRLLDNILLPLRAQRRLDADARTRVAALIETAGLTGFERYYPHELSGGMRKRASLVRTLAYDPPVILMDEPFGALDAQTRTELHADLLRLWSLKRKTIVFVTHDITEAIALGDRVLVLSRAPARVVDEYRVDLPRPRDVDHLIAEPAFARLYESIRQSLARQAPKARRA
ncbi:ABC transporter ATP-binding protein [Vineibacter terrae]|uniref:ABC transporter ATP-binding protein n=1 Tax=Vineibacter terrae TaxID=2586908 RepID=A0A5C8PQU5_9HYPH|nr:ABC transporter ATP-binding protein [Vineibacter terrae]TXL77563.1 ABC transporter ATP-binding protein [Vineibacter terrae]